MVNENLVHYQANIAVQPAPPFEGTVMPIQKSLDWVGTPAPEWKLSYSDVSSSRLVDIFKYDPQKLEVSTSELEWGNPDDNLIRNMKITYSVPYMGNYKLGGGEHTGSHLAVDIKAIKGTPVFAVANGIVVKVSNQTYGFGKHVVVKHENVPLVGDSGKTHTLYSSYSHLDSYSVSEGDAVSKGKQIGTVGDTGTATTDHLHFQIDTTSAPWHPYWPFTSQEASDAGYSFTEAINNGLGRDRALENTINPLEWVQEFNTGKVTSVADVPVKDVDDEPEGQGNDDVENEIGRVLFYHGLEHGLNDKFEVRIKLLDQDTNDLTAPTFEGGVDLRLKNERIASLSKDRLDRNDFVDGVATVEVSNRREGSTRIIAEYNGDTFSSEEFTVQGAGEAPVDDEEPVDLDEIQFTVSAPVTAGEGDDIVATIEAVDGRGEAIQSLSDPVILALTDDLASLERTDLIIGDFANGKASVMLRGLKAGEFEVIVQYKGRQVTSDPIVVKSANAQVAALVVEHDGVFVPDSVEEIIIYAADEFGDKVSDFKPVDPIVVKVIEGEANVSQQVINFTDFEKGAAVVEFEFKGNDEVVIEATDGKLEVTSERLKPGLFSDVGKDHENYRAISYLREIGVVQGYDDGSFKPDQSISRVEVLKMILAALEYDLESTADVDFSDISTVAWYSPYLATAVDKGIVAGYPDRTFKPSNSVNAAEFFKMLTEASGIEVDEDVEYKPYLDVDAEDWYAAYAQFVKNKRLIDSARRYFRAGDEINRAEVAESIYRLLIINKNSVKFYRDELD